MELRDFATQVLFSTSLDEKLRTPDVITDVHPGTAIAAPAMPGRPRRLRFKSQGARNSGGVPGPALLEQSHERGRLLHFFANHELLATELMALVLLRFPQAPAAFRRGVLQTLKDEQEHTRLYLERLRACGLEFGDIPVSGYFWRCLAGMENPVDYVAGLSLTFEQANLDFARHFAKGFAAVGDADSASLLERIYRDEIGHVAYGLKWFRRWKHPGQNDWEAFCRQLKYPLSPQRAKGFSVNTAARRAAGFDDHFIAELEVYARSKGRTPTVFVFNPLAEGYIAAGRRFSPRAAQRQLARDLANLPQFLCRRDDIILVAQRPSVDFLREIRCAGFPLPEFVICDERGHIDPAADLSQRRLGALRPWAWAPDSIALFEPLLSNVAASERRTSSELFNPRLAELFSKEWSAGFLRRMLAQWSEESWLCTEAEVGMSARSLDEVGAAIAAIRARGHERIVLKQALGVAGHNALRLWERELSIAQRRWISNELAGGRVLVVEPWLERVLDFSVQLEMTSRGLQVRGYTGLITTATGRFEGNWAAANHARRLPAQVVAALCEPADVPSRLSRLFWDIRQRLESELANPGYRGPLGIDAFVYRDASGTNRVKPVVEINPRYTMGRLTLELMRGTLPGRCGCLRLLNLNAVRAAGCAGFVEYARELQARRPLRFAGEPLPRILEGALCLNDPAAARVCLATFQVDRTLEAATAPLVVGDSDSTSNSAYA